MGVLKPWRGIPKFYTRGKKKPSEPTLEILELLEEILQGKTITEDVRGRLSLNLQRLQNVEAETPTWKLLNRFEFKRNVRAEGMGMARNRSHGNGWCASAIVHQENKTKRVRKERWAIPKFKGVIRRKKGCLGGSVS